jgi:hypothetical protein
LSEFCRECSTGTIPQHIVLIAAPFCQPHPSHSASSRASAVQVVSVSGTVDCPALTAGEEGNAAGPVDMAAFLQRSGVKLLLPNRGHLALCVHCNCELPSTPQTLDFKPSQESRGEAHETAEQPAPDSLRACADSRTAAEGWLGVGRVERVQSRGREMGQVRRPQSWESGFSFSVRVQSRGAESEERAGGFGSRRLWLWRQPT